MTDFELEKLLHNTLSKGADIPDPINDMFCQIFENLDDATDTEIKKVRSNKMSRRTFIILVAAIITAVLFASGVLAYSLVNPQFYKSVFGTGVSGNEGYRTDYSADGYEREFPLYERVEVDVDEAENAVGAYVRVIGQKIVTGETTLYVNDFIIDDNGIGCVTYTLEREKGLDGYFTIISGLELVYTGSPLMLLNGKVLNSPLFLSDEGRTDTTAYLVQPFCLHKPLEADTSLTVWIPDSANGEGYKIEMPLDIRVPVQKYASEDGKHLVELSPLGMKIECLEHDEGTCSIGEIVIKSTDEDYLVRSSEKNIDNTSYSVGWGVSVAYDMPQPTEYNASSRAFNRLVVTEKVTEILFDDVKCYPLHE